MPEVAKSTYMCLAVYLNQCSGIFVQCLQGFSSSDSWSLASMQLWQQTQEQLAISMSSGQNAKALANHQAPADVASVLCRRLKVRCLACRFVMWCINACMAGNLPERCISKAGSCMPPQPQQYCGSECTHMHSDAPSSGTCTANSEHRTQHAI